MMKCKKVIERYDDVVEGSLSWKESRAIDQHLQTCSVCASQFEELKSYRHLLRTLKPAKPPQDFELNLKIVASKQGSGFRLARNWQRLRDLLYPIAIPAVSGVVLTVFSFVSLLSIFIAGVNLDASIKDTPLGIMTDPQPRLVYMSQFVQLDRFESVKEPITVETTISHEGRVLDYRILKGPQDPETKRSLDQFLFFEARVDPATSFGRPTEGRLVLSLVFFPTANDRIDVKG
ncbi:MAG: zf-HC2 domain-containing protein [Terriglobia bacterium]